MENTTVKVNKAAEKRAKQAREALTYRLSAMLIDFKERFLGSYVAYEMSLFDRDIKHQKERKFNSEKDGKHGKTEASFNAEVASVIAAIEVRKARVNTNTLKFIVDANDNYNDKFSKMVSALVEHGVQAHPLHIERISNSTVNDFGFLIKHNDITVHARVIFACGPINAPHYRFIITRRETTENDN